MKIFSAVLCSLLVVELVSASILDIPPPKLEALFGKRKHSKIEDLPSPVVQTSVGKIRGLVREVFGGHRFNFFHSIRYGQAKRFAKAEPVGPWEGVYDATHVRSHCPQMNPTVIHQSEDCLFLNVWQPLSSTNATKLKPVMVWIYGGGFSIGSTNMILYNGAYLATIGDVIVVDMNYRLGALGFLYTGTEEAPGNQGVHDMILALKWVQNNIEAFGGDPNMVTVFGESAGSFAISMMMMSPLAKGLFHRAILQSGAITNMPPFSPQGAKDESRKFAKRVGCDYENPRAMVECLRHKSTFDLVIHGQGLSLIKMFAGDNMVIMYEDYHGLLPGKPSHLIQNGSFNSVDMLFGFLHDELGEIVVFIDPEIANPLKHWTKEKVDERLHYIASRMRMPNFTEPVHFYTRNFPRKPSLHEAREVFTEMLSDAIIACPTHQYGQMMALRPENADKHFYSYRFDKRSPFMDLIGCFKFMGVCHGVDVPYTWGMPLETGIKLVFSNSDRVVSFDMIKAWSNFAKTGHPQRMGKIEWPEVIPDRHAKSVTMRQMAINDQYHVIENVYTERCNFWHPYIYGEKPLK